MTEDEFIKQVQAHSGIIQKLVYLYVDDPSDQEDLRQEIQLQAWKAVQRFRGDAKFSTWLYRIALNTILTFNRKKKVELTSLTVSMDVSTEQHEPSDKKDQLLKAIKSLPDIDKTIITLHLEDYDNREIADMTGMAKNHVAVKLHRIKSRLKNRLTNNHE